MTNRENKRSIVATQRVLPDPASQYISEIEHRLTEVACLKGSIIQATKEAKGLLTQVRDLSSFLV